MLVCTDLLYYLSFIARSPGSYQPFPFILALPFSAGPFKLFQAFRPGDRSWVIPHLVVTRSVTVFHRITPSLPPLRFHAEHCLLPNRYVWILALFCFSGEQKILENRAIFCFCPSLIRQFIFCSCDKKKNTLKAT